MNPSNTDRDQRGSGRPPLVAWGRGVLLVSAGLAVGLSVLVGLLLASLQFDAVSGYLARTGASMASSDSLQIHVSGATGGWLRGIELTGVRVEASSGGAPAWTLSADTLSARYRLLPLIRRHVAVSAARAAGVEAWVGLTPADDERDEDPSPASEWTIAVDRAEVDVRELAIATDGAPEPWVLTDGRLRLGDIEVSEAGMTAVLDMLEGSFRPPERPTGWGRFAAAGALGTDRMHISRLAIESPESDVRAQGSVPLTLAGTAPAGLALDVALDPLHLQDVAPFLPEMIPDSLRVTGEGRIWVSEDTTHVRFTAATNVSGQLSLEGRVWGPRSAPDIAGEVAFTSLDLQGWGVSETPLVVHGEGRAAVAGVSPEEIRGMHGLIAFDARADDAAGPLGTLRVDVSADSARAPWRGGWRAAGMGLDASGTAILALEEEPEWLLTGALSYLDQGAISRFTGGTTAEDPAFREVVAAAGFEAQGRGFDPDSLSAQVRVMVDSLQARMGRGGTLARVGPGVMSAEMDRGSATLQIDIEAGGGRVDLAAEGDVVARTLRSIRGTLDAVDVAALVGDTLPSTLSADITGEVADLSPLRASGTLRVHEASYGPWSVDSARASADAAGDDVGLSFAVALPDSGRVEAHGSAELAEGAVRRVMLDSLGWAHLDVRQLAAATAESPLPPTSLHGTGEGEAMLDDDGWTGSLALHLAPSTVGSASVDAGTVRLDAGPSGSELSAVIEAGEMLVEAEARSDGMGAERRFFLQELRFREVDVAAFMAGDVTPTSLTGSGSATIVGTTPETAVGTARLDLWGSRIGSNVFDTASVVVSADSGSVQGEGRVDGLGGSLRFDADAALGAATTYSVRGTVERLAAPDDRGLAIMARFGLAGQGTVPDSMDAEVWFEVDSARWAGHDVERGSFRAGLADATLRLDTLSVSLPGAELAGGGTLPLAAEGGRRGEIHLTGSLTRAELIQGFRESGVLAIGEAGIDLTAQGAVDDVELNGDAFITALLVDDIRIQGMQLRGDGRHTTAEGWVRGEGRLEVDRVRLPTAPIQSLEIDATLEPDDEVAITASAVIDGRRDAELSMRVEQLPAPSAFSLENMAFRADEDRWVLQHPTRISLQDGFHVDSLRLGAEGQGLELRGRIGTEGPLDLRAGLQAFDISTVADLLGYPTLRGRVSGELEVTGEADAPILRATLQSRLAPQNAPAADLALSMGYDDGAASVDATISLDDGPSLRMDASVPVDVDFSSPADGLVGNAPMRGTIRADAFPMRWFEPFLTGSGARDLVGRLDGIADMEGTPDAPSFQGQLTLRGGGVTLPELGVRYREAAADLTLRGTEVVIDSARVRSDDGVLTSSGVVTLNQIDRPSYDVALNANGFTAMRSSAIHATISGRVNVRGTGLAPEVTGVVDVERADLYLEDLLSGSSVDAVELTAADWEELASVFGYTRADGDAEPSPLMEVVTLDLDVRLGRASWVRQRSNPQMALQFSGEMAVQKQPGDSLQLVGSVEAVPDRSWVEQFGRRFDITQGVLTFQGPPSATDVQVEAQYGVPSRENPGEPEVVLMLSVSGTPEDLNLELSSTPPLEASDMVAYLVTGRPASQSLSGGGEGSLTDAGGALALGRLSGAVEAYAREQVGLDVVEITTDGLDGVTLLAGRFLSPDLYLGVRQPITLQRAAEDPTQRAPSTEIELELQAVRWLLLNLRAGGRRGVEFYVRSRIAYD